MVMHYITGERLKFEEIRFSPAGCTRYEAEGIRTETAGNGKYC